MAISDTYTFNPDIGEIVEEAYERAGLEMRSGYDLRTARRSLNFLTLEWQNRGINLWTVDSLMISEQSDGSALTTNYLVKDVSGYSLDSSTIAVLDMVLRVNDGTQATQVDYHMSRVSQSTYAAIPNKLSRGMPLQYYLERRGILDTEANDDDRKDRINIWPAPGESSKYKILYWRIKRIADSGGSASETMEVPSRFMPALVSGLAYHIAMKKPEAAGRVELLKQVYEEEFMTAAGEDREKAPVRFVPRMYRT